MPNTKITKEKWKDHYSYAKKVYIIGFIVTLLASNLVFSVTRYTPPSERSVIIQLVDSYVDTEPLADLAAQLLAEAQKLDDTLEDVSFLNIGYSGDPSSDYYGAQAYMVQIYAGENDIYLLNEVLLNDHIAQGYCLPLETLEGFNEFMKKHPEVTPIWRAEPSEDGYDDEDATEGEAKIMHVYALDASTLKGFVTRNAFSVRGKYALISAISTNVQTSFNVLSLLYDYISEAPAPLSEASPSEVAP